jgi:protein-S-isoprenylcysteine O-methyltransferase Ste14
MKVSKIITSIALTAFMFVLPLGSFFYLIFTPQIASFCIGSLWSLLTQPAVDWQRIKSTKDEDRYTAVWIMAAITVSQMLSVLEWAHFHSQHIFRWNVLTIAGVICIVLGGILRYWAIKTLGRYFTASVSITDSQKISTAGPYKILRHPSYTGGLMTVVGTPLVLENTYSVFLALFLMILAYMFRIKAEEKAMIKTFGDLYRTYQQNTKKLIPLLW